MGIGPLHPSAGKRESHARGYRLNSAVREPYAQTTAVHVAKGCKSRASIRTSVVEACVNRSDANPFQY
ncbi:hypothetical protein X801_10114 [Opisthorchis viverrini]|uniref:Uncharacterized protein n=1 Tax=Opisthorchis viverrini TaxID=6198 RepID=A0A1S8WI17_OPIVI|nr:hypothetical protein X801_10114 [Opisthorchis viverrini]